MIKPTQQTLVYTGANTSELIVRSLLSQDPTIRFVTSQIFNEAPLDFLDEEREQGLFIKFDSGIKVDDGGTSVIDSVGFNDLSVINKVINDKNLPLLWTRFNRKYRYANNTEVKRYEVSFSLIKAAIKTCVNHKPQKVVFSYEPHMLPMYIFKKVVEALDIDTYTLTISPFVWRLYCQRNSGDMLISSSEYVKQAPGENESVGSFIKEKQSHYTVAKPFYEKRAFVGGIRQTIKSLKVNGYNLERLIRSKKISRCYASNTTQRSVFHREKYICFFLQYQPEQTTLPDGGLFVNQLFAIQMLYASLQPLGISLVIREHPATFESTFDHKWRDRSFYNEIKRFGEKVYFDQLTADPFELIDNSVGVASITGTVLLEGLLKGKPAIAFGSSPLKKFLNDAFVEGFENDEQLAFQISQALRKPKNEIISETENYLHEIYLMTFGDKEYLGNQHMTLSKLREARNNALVDVLKRLNS